MFVAAFVVQFPMPSWVCQWKPFWIPFGESFKKAFLEECVFIGDDSSDEQRVSDFLVLIHSTGNTDYTRDVHPPTPRPARQPDSLPWESTRPQDKAYFLERIEAHCLLYHPRQLHPPKAAQSLPERLELPFSSDEILSGYEDIVSSGTDHFTAWVKMDPREVLVHHMVDVQKATADFREASERRPATSSQTNCANICLKLHCKSRECRVDVSQGNRITLSLSLSWTPTEFSSGTYLLFPKSVLDLTVEFMYCVMHVTSKMSGTVSCCTQRSKCCLPLKS